MDTTEFQKALRAQLDTQKEVLRPILTSLNGDNGWLMSFPRPSEERTASGKAYYHVVFEPWLGEPSTLLSEWLLGVSLTQKPAFSDAAALEDVVAEIEAVAGHHPPHEDNESNIDAIFLGFTFDDHTHKASLTQFNPRIPVFGTSQVAAMIKPWNHFETINVFHDLATDAKTWRGPDLHPGEPLPSWLTILRLRGHKPLHFCTTIVWTHTVAGEEVNEALMIAPHGIRMYDGPLRAFLDAEPRTEKLAMMATLKEAYSYGDMQSMGVRAGLELYRRIGGATYWVLSHEQRYSYTGLIMRLFATYDVPRTLDWGLEQERKKTPEERRMTLTRPNLVGVENGSCLVLN